jgi:hypothetical protein
MNPEQGAFVRALVTRSRTDVERETTEVPLHRLQLSRAL